MQLYRGGEMYKTISTYNEGVIFSATSLIRGIIICRLVPIEPLSLTAYASPPPSGTLSFVFKVRP